MNTKIVYQTGPDGRYVGPTEADESPLEPGVWLIPAGAVETPPPEAPEGHFTRWSGTAWEVVPVPAPPEPEPAPPEPEPEAPPKMQPQAATARQVRLWLLSRGILPAKVEALIDTLPPGRQEEARIEWEYATVIERSNPLLRTLAARLFNLDDQALDEALDRAFAEAVAL
jgi:hypothetical protein